MTDTLGAAVSIFPVRGETHTVCVFSPSDLRFGYGNLASLPMEFQESVRRQQEVTVPDSRLRLLPYWEPIWKAERPVIPGKRTPILHFTLNESCNMDCVYCWRKNSAVGNNGSSELDVGLGKDILRDFFQEYGSKESSTNVIFYGTEPLLSRQLLIALIDKTVSLSAVHDADTEITVNTNGTLIDEDVADYFARHQVNVIVSLDGPPEINDRQRKFPEGKGTFKRINRGLGCLRQRNVPFAIATTVCPNSPLHVMDIVSWLIDEFDPVWLGLNILENSDNPEDLKTVAEQTLDAFFLARDRGIPILEMLKRIAPLIEGHPKRDECCACNSAIRISPHGYMAACHHFFGMEGYYCDAKKGIRGIEDMSAFRIFRQRGARFRNKSCDDCFARATCGGGCPSSSFKQTGSIEKPDMRICIQARTVVPRILCEIWRCQPVKPNIKSTVWVPCRLERTRVLQGLNLHKEDIFMLAYHLLNPSLV